MGPAHRQCIGDISRPIVGFGLHPGQQVSHTPFQRRYGAARKNEQVRSRTETGGWGSRALLQHNMGVRATESERTDRGAEFAGTGPGAGFRVHHEWAVGEINMSVRGREVQACGERAVTQCLHGLQQTRNARCRHRVTDIGLDRSDGAESLLGRVSRERVGQRGNLDRVAQPGSGSMRLDQADRCGIDAGLLVDRAFKLSLRCCAGRGQSAGLPILIDAGGQHHRVDTVAITDGIGQAFQDDDAHSLSGYETIGCIVECLAPALGRGHPGVR